MIYHVYAMRDIKVGFTPPTLDISDDAAIRGFAYSMTRSNPMFAFAPQDFQLFHVADFDVDNGIVTPVP